jgi:hypothetical protein
MIYYSTELVVEKPMDEVLLLLPAFYYDGLPELKDGVVRGYHYSCRTLLFAIDTTISVYTAGGSTFILMSSIAREHGLISFVILYLLKPLLQMRQMNDLRYLKQRIEKR